MQMLICFSSIVKQTKIGNVVVCRYEAYLRPSAGFDRFLDDLMDD